MKKITFLLAAFMLLATVKTNGQENQECIIKYNLFKGDYLSKKYNESFDNWMYLMDNCKDLSVNIYKYGSTLAEDVKKSPALAKRVYEQRLQYFPDNDPAKVHSDYATYLIKNKLATDDEIFELLEKAYKISPQDMGAKNIYRYFQGVTDKYKDVNPQKVFDTYDDVLESVGEKLDDYTKKINDLTKDSTKTLSNKEKRYLRIYTVNSKALGQIEGGLDAMISEIATCERLIPIYTRDFETFKNDAVWLRRAVSRMFLISATRCQTPSARSCAALFAAAPNPAIATTFSVPARRPISWPPPLICAGRSSPRRKTTAPTPFGPPILCAEISAISAPSQLKATGNLPNACVASVTAKPFGRLCTIPVSELAICSTDDTGSVISTVPSARTK